jgi:hypothetical protein
MYFILEGKKPVMCLSRGDWIRWFYEGGGCHRVARDDIGPFVIQTHFIGQDPRPCTGHGPSLSEDAEPHLFHTWVEKGTQEIKQFSRLYPTWELAEVGHRRTVLRVRNSTIRAA